MPSEHERPSMFAPGHRQSDIDPPDEQPPPQGEASQQGHPVHNPHYERWYREHHRQKAYEALTQDQIRRSVPAPIPPTTSRNTQATELVRRPSAANSYLLQQAQSSNKARRSSQVINGVLHARPVASSSAKSPLQNDLTQDDGGTREKSGPHLSLVPPTPPKEDTAATNVPPRQNTNSLTVPNPYTPQPEANTQRSTQRENERHPPSLTSGVEPSQSEVRDVPERSLPALSRELKVRNVPIDRQDFKTHQQGQHHDAQSPLLAPTVEPAVRNRQLGHRGTRYYDTQCPLPAPPVELAVDLPSLVTAGPDLGNLSRLSYLIWYGGGRSGGVQPVIRNSARPAIGLGNQTVGSHVRPPALDPLGESVLQVEGLFELEAGVDPMAALGAAIIAFTEEERDYTGYSSVRGEGPPVLPQLLIGDGSVGLDFAPPATNEQPEGDSDEQPAAEMGTSAPIYELFQRERNWDFDMDVAERYIKFCGTNHNS